MLLDSEAVIFAALLGIHVTAWLMLCTYCSASLTMTALTSDALSLKNSQLSRRPRLITFSY